MKLIFTIVLFLVAPLTSWAQLNPSEKAFTFPEELTRSQSVSFKEQVRSRILKALKHQNRDQILQTLSKQNLIAMKQVEGENWFDLRGFKFRKGDIDSSANLSRICLDYVRFDGVSLKGANFDNTLLRGATFEGTDLSECVGDHTNLSSSVFIRCTMNKISFGAMTQFGKGTKFVQCVMDEANFDQCNNVKYVDFTGCSLKKASFVNASLFDAKFANTDLTGANLALSDLSQADLYKTKIDGVDFTDTNLSYTKLQEAKLSTPLRLVRTILFHTTLGDLDISKVDVSYINWYNDYYHIGEEDHADGLRDVTDRKDRRKLYAQSESIYRALGEKYKQAGHINEYLEFRYHSLDAKRKLMTLASGTYPSWEYLWLCLSWTLDGYGTKPFRLLASSCIMIGIFACVHLVVWLKSKNCSVEWNKTTNNSQETQDTQISTTTTEIIKTPCELYNTLGRPKLQRLLSVYSMAISFSLGASLTFFEKIVGVPYAFDLVNKNGERLVPIGKAKIIYGVQALTGAFFIFMAVRMFVTMLSTY